MLHVPDTALWHTAEMLEHVSLPLTDYGRAKDFYTKVLAALGYKLSYEFDGACGFMEGGHTSFWIVERPQSSELHIAFRAKSAAEVEAFHTAALDAGAKDNGAPGYRDYSPDYYAAFFLDADGNNVEAVWYDPTRSETLK